jgi:hypothetical protein
MLGITIMTLKEELPTREVTQCSVRGETQIFRQFGFRQHFARFAQNASIRANGEIQYMLKSKSTVLGQFLKVWIQNCCLYWVKRGLSEA